jgi:DNA polymerase III subunit epsilon
MALDFTAIDFEAANSYRGSPCSVGIVRVRDGQIVDESSTLIHPLAQSDHFDGFNTWLHGIKAEMVVGTPSWRRTLEWIIRYVDSDSLVCHNAGLDMGVIRYACIADDLQWPSFDFLCTMVLARRACRLPSYRLPFVAAECDVDLRHPHQAVSDARCAALITMAMARKQSAQTWASYRVHRGADVKDPTDGMGRRDQGRRRP